MSKPIRPGRTPRSIEEIDLDIVNQLKTQFKVVKGCHIWTGAYFDNGYARISRHLSRASFHMRAHIASYQFHKGPVKAGLFVCHSCDVKGCINPKHLWLGTNQENQLDASKKGAFAAYWTPERRARKSKEMSGEGNPMFGVSGDQAPCYGRTGKSHPMFGKHHTEEAKNKISSSLIKSKRNKS